MMSRVGRETLSHAFMIPFVDYSNPLPSGVPLERGLYKGTAPGILSVRRLGPAHLCLEIWVLDAS